MTEEREHTLLYMEKTFQPLPTNLHNIINISYHTNTPNPNFLPSILQNIEIAIKLNNIIWLTLDITTEQI